MKQFFIILFVLYVSFSFGQERLVLKKGIESRVLRPGKKIALVFKNDNDTIKNLANWKTICKPLVSSSDTIWSIKSFTTDSIHLQIPVAYKFDTIKSNTQTSHEKKTKRKIFRNERWEFVNRCNVKYGYKTDTIFAGKDTMTLIKKYDTISLAPNEFYIDTTYLYNLCKIFKKPSDFINKKSCFNDIRSIMFSRNDNCTKDEISSDLIFLSVCILGTTSAIIENGVDSKTMTGLGLTSLFAGFVIAELNDNRVKTYDLTNWKIIIK